MCKPLYHRLQNINGIHSFFFNFFSLSWTLFRKSNEQVSFSLLEGQYSKFKTSVRNYQLRGNFSVINTRWRIKIGKMELTDGAQHEGVND